MTTFLWWLLPIEEVYNEFSSGAPDVSAIRDFMKMFFTTVRSSTFDMPKYLLLMGDASYDNKNRLASIRVTSAPRGHSTDLPLSRDSAWKWPNDLYVAGGKLAGILVEARWRERNASSGLAIGIGLNIAPPADLPGAAGLDPGTRRSDVLAEMIPGNPPRRGFATGGFSAARNSSKFDTRDMARGHRCVEPALGMVRGITASGEALVALADSVARFRSVHLSSSALTEFSASISATPKQQPRYLTATESAHIGV